MSNDVAFLAEFSDGSPTHSALELAAGAAELAGQGKGSAVGLAYGPGAGDAASLGAAGASPLRRPMVVTSRLRWSACWACRPLGLSAR